MGRYSRGLAAALRDLRRPDGTPLLQIGVFGPAAHALPPDPPSRLRRVRDLALETPLATHLWLPARLAAFHPRLVHSTAFVGPLWGPGPLVLTFHDLIYHHQPADYDRLWRLVIETLAPRALRRARAVIAISQATSDDLARTYRVPRRKLHVVPIAVDPAFFAPHSPAAIAALRARYGLPPVYLLHTGGLVRRKNLPLLLRAFARHCAATGDTSTVLALTGQIAPGMAGGPELAVALADSPVRAQIRLLGHVPGPDLPALVAGATALVYPTLWEGQGLPPLEAMAAGTPVLASTTPAVAEVAAPAALLVAPTDEAAWAAALTRLLTHPTLRADLTARGHAHAATYTWPLCARATLAVYRAVARGAGSRGD
ncbi:MAG: glycosyltransferase family 4 protein [Chloroflexota bacterium]|nr:glycosyltransferase family 4 protein [Chloroflexota bacterium]